MYIKKASTHKNTLTYEKLLSVNDKCVVKTKSCTFGKLSKGLLASYPRLFGRKQPGYKTDT